MEFNSKQDFKEWMQTVAEALRPWYSEGKARLRLGDTGVCYTVATAEMEAFARPLWGLAPYWAGGGSGFDELYRQGLINGTDPAHPEYWGTPVDCDQKFVEMAEIAAAMLLAPEKIWNPLSQEEKEQAAHWLNEINCHMVPDCNWQFFMVLVNVALKKRGCHYDEKNMQMGLEKIESYYVGDGWYRDGVSNQKDYYIAFAMHYYGLLYASFMEEEDPERSRRFKDRAEIFAKDFIYWFDENGAALPYGRSLTYRFAQAAFWSAYLFAGLKNIPVDVVKGIIVRHLKWWEKQKVFDRDGVMTIGYAYPNLIMAERYNGPGSSYWGLKTMLCLALPDEHPFWNVKAAELPKLPPLRPIPQAHMLVQRNGSEVVAYPAAVCERDGHGHVWEKYAKFAYSTRFGFSVARSQAVLHENAPDSNLAFVLDGSDYVFVRERSLSFEIMEDRVVSCWEPFPGIHVRTEIVPCEGGHLRIHEVESAYACTAYDCGFSVEKYTPGYKAEAVEREACAGYDSQGCRVSGEGPQAAGIVIAADTNTNVLYPNSSLPAVSYRIEKDKKVRLETKVQTWISK